MHRMSFVAGTAAALAFAAGAWGVHQSIQTARAAPDKSLGAAAMSATVASNGTLMRGAGAVSASKVTTGSYDITFYREVLGCSYVAGVGHHTPGGGALDTMIAANPHINNPSTIRVLTQLVLNGGTVSSFDQNFHLLVFCHE